MTDRLLPLSHRQLSIWTGQKLDPGLPLYNMAWTYPLGFDVDVDAFSRAFEKLVDTVDAFRMVVVERDGEPMIQTLDRMPFELPVIDFSDRTDPASAARAWCTEQAGSAFDLGERVFTSALIKRGHGDYEWFLNQHHLFTDAWSMSVLLQRQGELYELAQSGDLATVRDLPSYHDFVADERRGMASDRYRETMNYWRDKTAAPRGLVDFYGARPEKVGPRTTRVSREIRGGRAERLAAFLEFPDIRSISPELSVLRVFETTLFACLHKVSGLDRLAVGAPHHNRQSAAFKQTAGLFMNLFPATVDIEADESMATLLDKVGAEVFDALRHGRLALERQVEAASFEVVLNYIHAPLHVFAGRPTAPHWIHTGHDDPAHALRLQVMAGPGPGEFDLHFDVKVDLFDERAQQWIADHYLRVLDAWIDRPGLPLRELHLLSPDEQRILVRRFNRAPSSGTTEQAPTDTLVDRFEAQVELTPSAAAVVEDRITLTFEELDRCANRAAHELLRLDVGPGSIVGLVAGPSAHALVGALGVLKTGAAYLPLDPETPAARLADVFAEAGVTMALTAPGASSRLVPPEVRSLAVSLQPAPAVGSDDTSRPAVDISGDADAYVIFTSGSTGRPKGVPIQHRALVNYLRWAADEYVHGRPADFAFFTSMSFDLTVTSMFVPLITGGCARVYHDDAATGMPAVAQAMRDDRVEVAKMTPSHLGIVRDLDLRPQRLHTLIIGGEDFKRQLAADVFEQLGGRVAIHNEYGPTETVVGCMIHRFDPMADSGPSVPIGRPAAGARVYLLDKHGVPVPPGVVGEIHIGGPGVAAGYLGRPELTAERFVDAPAALREMDPDLQGRLYRSGDLGRWTEQPSGGPRLDFLGRADDQVKIRGHRIELGEIESALSRIPAVTEAAVVAVVETVGGSDTQWRAAVTMCVRCGLPSNFPDARFDDHDICSLCRSYDTYRDKVDEYFRDLDELRSIAEAIEHEQRDAPYDCMVLLSGGKDSTYMLYHVAELGLRPLVFSLDNGYISDAAKENCRRVTDHLGFDLVVGTTPHMNEIFADSLGRFSNVCHGCFKTIYTLSMNLAHDHGIRHVFTGLSRGQLFETRLSDMYNHEIFDADQIDRFIVDARKAYHRIDDAVSRRLDVELFEDDTIFDEIRFVDYYRFTDVGLEEVMDFLAEHTPWQRPPDTGRSTNCLINDVGIHVHKQERGFHNYAFPYSWDVRLGHKERDAALAELDDEIDEEWVSEVLVDIGYKPKRPDRERQVTHIVAYYGADESVDADELRSALGEQLPAYMVPTEFVQLDGFPLAPSGKVDRAALANRSRSRTVGPPLEVAPEHRETATKLLAIWRQVFDDHEIALGDNFFDLGGDSIISIQIVSRGAEAGMELTPRQIFDEQTVAALAPVVDANMPAEPGVGVEQGPVTGSAPLAPIQARFFGDDHVNPSHWNQMVRLEAQGELDTTLLEAALRAVAHHHDALRLRFSPPGGDQAGSQHFAAEVGPLRVERLDLSDVDRAGAGTGVDQAVSALNESFDIVTGPIIGAVHVHRSHENTSAVWLAIHHLAVDAVSWGPLLADLDTAYGQLLDGEPVSLPPKTASYRAWALEVEASVTSDELRSSRDHWSAPARRNPSTEPSAATGMVSIGPQSARLDATTTQSMLETARTAYNTEITELLLTALVRSIRPRAEGRSLTVDVEGHGRDTNTSTLDVSRTVGWFTSIAPIDFHASVVDDVGTDIIDVKETVRAAKPHMAAFDALRHFGGDARLGAALSARRRAPVLFNYLGRVDTLTAEAARLRMVDGIELSTGPNDPTHPIVLDCFLRGGELHVIRSGRGHELDPAGELAERFVDELRLIVQHCVDPEAGRRTPSDFPAAGLDQQGLDRLAELLGE